MHGGIVKGIGESMKKVGLALGGGGVRGTAHIAYLEAMEQCGIKPQIISGTSAGAIVGALYAGGFNPQDILGLLDGFLGKERRRILPLMRKRKNGGLIAAFARDYFERILPKKRFEELDIPLKIVTTNFHTLEEKVFEHGDILPALMGSIAFPNVFIPQYVQGEYYMDGGATNIVPFDIIRSSCDVLIAIDVSLVRSNQFSLSTKNALRATWAATHETLISAKQKQTPVEIFERPSFSKAATMEFHKYKMVYQQAQEYKDAFIEKLKKNVI